MGVGRAYFIHLFSYIASVQSQSSSTPRGLEDIYRVKFARMRHITRISASHKRVIELADDDRDRLRLLIHLFAAGIPESYLVLELCSPLPARAPRGSASGVWSACVYKYSRCGASSPRPSLARSPSPSQP